jgi:hypothetical protein
MTSLPAGPSLIVTQYLGFFFILSIRNWLMSPVDTIRSKEAPKSLEISPGVAHCHRNPLAQPSCPAWFGAQK